jgi:hypothetical protein
MTFFRLKYFTLLVWGFVLSAPICAQTQVKESFISKVIKLTPTSTWKLVESIPLSFPAHHPQGMVKIGDFFCMSSVEVIDRAEGKGVGHLFKFDLNGKLLADVVLGENAAYHPGGIDFDGKNLWVPVAEYRPNSTSIVYKVDPSTLRTEEAFRFNDHIGGIVHDTDSHKLHGISWGSRAYYKWALPNENKPIPNPQSAKGITNSSFYIDYQDCHYVGNNHMLCGGLKTYGNGNAVFRLGGLELVNLSSHQAVYQIPLALYAPSGRPMTQNPFWLEITPNGLRGYFVPDDDQTTMYVYEVEVN